MNAAAHASTAVAAPAAAPKAAANSTVAVEAAEAKTGGSKQHFFFRNEIDENLLFTFQILGNYGSSMLGLFLFLPQKIGYII